MPRGSTASAAASPPWADLPEEALLNIASRLPVASDFVHFFAVCWNWSSFDSGGDRDMPGSLLPWLLAPSSTAGDEAEEQRCRCVFSKATYRAPGICVGDRRVAYTDGTAAWLVRDKDETFLASPLSAERLHLPAGRRVSSRWLDLRHRIVYGDDGCVLLYDFDPLHRKFQASFLHPSLGNKWFYLSSHLSSDRCCAAAFHRGGYVVCVDLDKCHILRPRQEQYYKKYNYFDRTIEVRAPLPEEPAGKVRRCSYLVEFDAGLLLASVLQEAGGDGLSVSLHELRLGPVQNDSEEPEVEWVRRDQSDSDMSLLEQDVLFLGFPGSFAIEAAEFSGEVSGGAAYFVLEDASAGGQEPTCSVYRYMFRDGATTLVERLPAGWHDANCMWFMPEPYPLEDSEPVAMAAPNAVEAPAEDHSRIRMSDVFAMLLVILMISALVWFGLRGFSFLRNIARSLI